MKKIRSKKLRIAVLASNAVRIPPRPQDVPPNWSGAPERVAWQITEGLVERGHAVAMYASGDTLTHAKLVSVRQKSSFNDPAVGLKHHKDWEFALATKCYQDSTRGVFDVIHSHLPLVAGPLAGLVKTPTVHTMHSPLTNRIHTQYTKNQYYVSISNNQRKPFPRLPWLSTIYHGLDLKEFPVVLKPAPYLIAVGRIHPSKGTHIAIAIAKKLGKPLRLMGSFDPKDPYFIKQIKPHIDGKRVLLTGFVSRAEYTRTIAHAEAMIFPLQWEEPFGLTMIEAMACGVPVVSFRRGSVPEIIQDKKTGFIVRTPAQALAALKRINTIDRTACRKLVEDRFSIDAMITGYEEAFWSLTNSNKRS